MCDAEDNYLTSEAIKGSRPPLAPTKRAIHDDVNC